MSAERRQIVVVFYSLALKSEYTNDKVACQWGGGAASITSASWGGTV